MKPVYHVYLYFMGYAHMVMWFLPVCHNARPCFCCCYLDSSKTFLLKIRTQLPYTAVLYLFTISPLSKQTKCFNLCMFKYQKSFLPSSNRQLEAVKEFHFYGILVHVSKNTICNNYLCNEYRQFQLYYSTPTPCNQSYCT